MGKKQGQELAEQTLYKYADLVDYDNVNKALTLKGDNIKEISKETIKNIGRWALNGADETEIAKNLELSDKQFKTFLQMCPSVAYIIMQGKEMANVIVAGSLLQTAIGGQIVRKQQVIKISEFNEDGIKVGEHYEKIWVEEELPPNPNLLKYIADHKLSEKFGDKQLDDDGKKFRKTLDNMSAEELKAIEMAIRNEN